ncbi:hypothetical protein NPIL_61131 [Nephila pilipes]|uniref:Uncharacterized protein n=1 Tax=Nephila pilipes TaxID=299642 RepID=A0A8X6NR27_NEPPI|nr:hypothetical protein NPIL_61131 [Nephila pilipes]
MGEAAVDFWIVWVVSVLAFGGGAVEVLGVIAGCDGVGSVISSSSISMSIAGSSVVSALNRLKYALLLVFCFLGLSMPVGLKFPLCLAGEGVGVLLGFAMPQAEHKLLN